MDYFLDMSEIFVILRPFTEAQIISFREMFDKDKYFVLSGGVSATYTFGERLYSKTYCLYNTPSCFARNMLMRKDPLTTVPIPEGMLSLYE